MSSINGIGGNAPIQNPQPVKANAPATPAAQTSRTSAADKLELSGVSHLLGTLKANGGVRTEKVAAIRAQLEAGTYEDDKKLDIATDRLLDDIQK